MQNQHNKKTYHMNMRYETIVKEEIDKLLDARFIYETKHIEWISPKIKKSEFVSTLKG